MSVATDGRDHVYADLECYGWDNDAEFQSGLSAILGSNSTPEQAAELALRARCFYYARKFNTEIDFLAYKAYRISRNLPPPALPTITGIPPNVLDTLPTTHPPPTANSMPEANVEASSASASTAEPPAPYPTSFAHIVELISSGKPIPGIKEIPPTVLEGQGTPAVREKRKKPWEKDEVTA